MKILAVDTSTLACSVSLMVDEQFYTEFELTPQTHANRVLAMLDKVLEDASVSGDSLDYIALSEGPGAFTGVRIAAGVVQGLAFGWQKKVISVSTLEAMAWQAWKSKGYALIASCLDARMNELYLQICRIEDGKLKSENAQLLSEVDSVAICEQNQIHFGVGDTQDEFPNLVEHFDEWIATYPNAEAIAEIASQRILDAKSVIDETPLPVYLRNNVAVKSHLR